jgi:FtsH-binding integral membrane protein
MENVFKRTDRDSPGAIIPAAVYNLIIGATLGWGFLVNWLIVRYVPWEALARVNIWVFLLAYMGSCFLGVFLFTKSSSPAVSFLGYNLVVVPFGFIINLVVHQYDPAVVLAAVRVTGLVTVIMMLLGSLFPVFFRKIAGALTVALLAVIVIELVEIFIFRVHHGVLDWAVAIIFCGYIGVDWGRANSIPKTVDNAIDSAAALYMDIINLFLRVLRIMGRQRR